MRARQSLQWSANLQSQQAFLLHPWLGGWNCWATVLCGSCWGKSSGVGTSLADFHSLNHFYSFVSPHYNSVDWRWLQLEMCFNYREAPEALGLSWNYSPFPGLFLWHYFPFDFMICATSNFAHPDFLGTFPLWFSLIANQTWLWFLPAVLSYYFKPSLAWISPLWHCKQEVQDTWSPSSLCLRLPHFQCVSSPPLTQ